MQQSNIFGNNNGKSEGVLGLDLGTTNSVVTAKITDGVPRVLHSKSGPTTPSCVKFNADDTVTIGNAAYANRENPDTIYSFKKYMGSSKELKVLIEKNDVLTETKVLVPRTVASIFVTELIKEVKEVNPEFVNYNSIHVSVPAYFDMNQREDTKLALEEAGYEVTGIMDEPTAAALVYQQIKRLTKDILVFDLGGGTFDAVLVRNIAGIPEETIKFYKDHDLELPNSESILEILDVTGDNRLGGDDIDEEAVRLFIEDYDLEIDEQSHRNLIVAAENVKKSGVPEVPKGFEHLFLFDYVQKATETVLGKAIAITDEMLNRTKVFDPQCVLCGGSTKSRVIKDTLAKRFTLSTDIDPDLAVGVGNAIQDWMNKTNTGTSVVSRLAKGIGVLVNGRIKYLAEKGSVIPLTTKFNARNATPYADFVNIEIYQGDRLTGDNTRITTLHLDNLEGHDEEGFIDVIISLTITKDGTISVMVESGSATISSVLSLSTEENTLDEAAATKQVHPAAKMYNRFMKAATHYDSPELNNLIDQYAETGERDMARKITKFLGELATREREQV